MNETPTRLGDQSKLEVKDQLIESMFMAMAFRTMKTKIGPKIQRWQEEVNRELNLSLLPTPLIRMEGTRMLHSRNVSGGQIRLEKIKVRIQLGSVKKVLEIYFERFNEGVGMSQRDQCKWPECTKTREPTSHARDSLYLCEFHRRRMENYFTKMCADIGIVVIGRHSPGDFEGYSALIEIFQNALCKAKEIYQERTEEGKLLQDLLLNVSNFLIIVNAVIKPDEDLLKSFLPHVMGIALEILKAYYQYPTANLVSFMQHFLEYILFFFGIISPWDSLFPESKPYCQIGMGLGGMPGVLGLFLISPPYAIAAMGIGGLLGAVAGNRLYINRRRREMLDTSYCRYLMFRHTQLNYQGNDAPEDMNFAPEDMNYLSGSAYVDTLLAVVLIVQALVLLMAL